MKVNSPRIAVEKVITSIRNTPRSKVDLLYRFYENERNRVQSPKEYLIRVFHMEEEGASFISDLAFSQTEAMDLAIGLRTFLVPIVERDVDQRIRAARDRAREERENRPATWTAETVKAPGAENDGEMEETVMVHTPPTALQKKRRKGNAKAK